MGHTEELNERGKEDIIGFHDPEVILAPTRVGETKIGFLEELENDMDQKVHHLSTHENNLKASRSLIFENKEESSMKNNNKKSA